jgi:hypothetical protein
MADDEVPAPAPHFENAIGSNREEHKKEHVVWINGPALAIDLDDVQHHYAQIPGRDQVQRQGFSQGLGIRDGHRPLKVARIFTDGGRPKSGVDRRLALSNYRLIRDVRSLGRRRLANHFSI